MSNSQLTLSDLRAAAEGMGLGTQVLHQGYPDPLLLLGPLECIIEDHGVGYEYPGFYVVLHFGPDEVLRHWSATQRKGNIAHPHIGGHGLFDFCYGDNNSTLTNLAGLGYPAPFIAAVIRFAKMFTRGAYADISSLSHANVNCYCVGGERICSHCRVKSWATNKTIHASQAVLINGAAIEKELANHTVSCRGCGRATLSEGGICDSCARESYCTLCGIYAREKGLEQGCHRTGCPVRGATLQSQSRQATGAT